MFALLLWFSRPRIRRWAWLVFLLLDLPIFAIAFVEIRGRLLWQNYQTEAAHRGVKLKFADIQWPPPVPAAENYAAIPLITEAFAGKENGLPFPSLPLRAGKDLAPAVDLVAWRDQFIREGWLPPASVSVPLPSAILTALGRVQEPLAQLHMAAPRLRCQFPTQWQKGVLTSAPHLSLFLAAGRAWQARIVASLENGRSEQAMSDVLDALAAYRALRTESFALPTLVRIKMLDSVERAVLYGLQRHAWVNTQLSILGREFEKCDALADFPAMVEFERASANEFFQTLFVQHDVSGFAPSQIEQLGTETSVVFRLRYLTGWGAWNITQYNRFADEILARAQTPGRWSGDLDFSQGTKRVSGIPACWFYAPFRMGTDELTYEDLIRIVLAHHTCNQALVAAMALERYVIARRALPPSLDALVPTYLRAVPTDIFDGQPLRYRSKPDGSWAIYGVGENRADDGGAFSFAGGTIQDLDWGWRALSAR